jgi:hypothetical protein
MWSEIQAYVTSPWTAFAVGVVTLILGWKMSSSWANLLLVVAWAVFVSTALRSPLLAKQPLFPRTLWAVCFGAVLGLGMYYTLWTVRTAALEVFASTSTADRPPGISLAGIAWSHKFTELMVDIANPSEQDFQDIDLKLIPDVAIAAIGQLTSLAGVQFLKSAELTIRPELWTSGKRQALDVIFVASTEGYRVRCDKLPSHSHAQVLMAAVNVSDLPTTVDADKLFRFTLTHAESAESFYYWFGWRQHSDRVFLEPPTPKNIRVIGSFRVDSERRSISLRLPIHNFGDMMPPH